MHKLSTHRNGEIAPGPTIQPKGHLMCYNYLAAACPAASLGRSSPHCFVQPGLHAETLPLFLRVPAAAAAAKMIIPVRCFTCGKVTCPSPLSSCSRGRRAAGLCCVSLSPRV
jgi:hypothetical protein